MQLRPQATGNESPSVQETTLKFNDFRCGTVEGVTAITRQPNGPRLRAVVQIPQPHDEPASHDRPRQLIKYQSLFRGHVGGTNRHAAIGACKRQELRFIRGVHVEGDLLAHSVPHLRLKSVPPGWWARV